MANAEISTIIQLSAEDKELLKQLVWLLQELNTRLDQQIQLRAYSNG